MTHEVDTKNYDALRKVFSTSPEVRGNSDCHDPEQSLKH